MNLCSGTLDYKHMTRKLRSGILENELRLNGSLSSLSSQAETKFNIAVDGVINKGV